MFLLLSVIPYSTGGNPDEAFLVIKANATVSPSYIILECGFVYNPTISTTLGTVHSQYSVWDGMRWTCGTSWTRHIYHSNEVRLRAFGIFYQATLRTKVACWVEE